MYNQIFFTFILYTTVYDIYCTTETILTYLLVHTDHGYGTIILLREGPLTKKYEAQRRSKDAEAQRTTAAPSCAPMEESERQPRWALWSPTDS